MLLARRSERTPRFRSNSSRSRRTISVVAVGGVLVVAAMPAPALFTTELVGAATATAIGEVPETDTSAEAARSTETMPHVAWTRSDGPDEPLTGVTSTGSGERPRSTDPTEPIDFELAATSVEIAGTVPDGVDQPAGLTDGVEIDDQAEEVEEQPLAYAGADGELIDADRLRAWLTDRNSPLADHAEELVAAGVEHDVDPRLVVGIAAIESSAGLRLPPGTHNAWGWSGNGPHGLKAWSSWPEAIHDFTERLARIYDTDNVDERMARKYVPPNWEKWLFTVRWVMDDI